MDNNQEKKNKNIGLFATLIVHALLIVAFVFLVAWREQIPPPEPIGMSMNFGFSDDGFGDLQPERNATQEQEYQEETQDHTQQEADMPKQVETVSDPVETTQPPSEALQEIGPVKAENPIVQEQPKTETPVKTETVQDKPQPQPEKIRSVYSGPPTDNTNNANSQGNTEGTTGDAGNKDGALDSNSSTGPGEGGGGFDHTFSGWDINLSIPDDKPEATGLLVFEITIDEYGRIETLRKLTTTGYPVAEKFYEDLIRRQMSFSYKLTGSAPPFSKGKISFNLKMK